MREPTVLWRLLSGGALALGGLFALAGCAAQQSSSDILDREVRTSISGDGVVSAEDLAGAGTNAPPVAEEAWLRAVGVEVASAASGTWFVVQLSRAPEGFRAFPLKAPNRCVIDLKAPVLARSGQTAVATGVAAVPQLRFGQSENRLRIVIDVASTASLGCSAQAQGSAVLVGVGSPPRGAQARTIWAAGDAPAGSRAHESWAAAKLTGRVGSPLSSDLLARESAALPYDAPMPAMGIAAAPPPAPRSPPRSPWEAVGREPDVRPAAVRYSGRPVSLEFKDADILNVLRVIADVSQRNIVATDDVEGKVTIVLHGVPWDQALDILLKSTGLEKVQYDDVITISTSERLEHERKARLAAQIAGRQLEPLQTAYLRINYVKPIDIANLMRGGDTRSAAGAGAVQDIADGGGGDDGSGTGEGILSPRAVVLVNEPTNTVIVRDIAEGIANAQELVRRLDVQTPQVAIQGLIFEADTDVGRELGVRWGASYQAGPETGNPTGRNFPGRVGIGGAGPFDSGEEADVPIMVDFPAPSVVGGAGSTLGLLLGSLDGSKQIEAELSAIEAAGRGRVVSRPKIITLNNAEANIESLEILRVRLPPQGTVISTGPGGSAAGAATATQAINTGIILKVTPQISSDGFVLLQLYVKSSVPSSRKSTDEIPNEISRQATSQVLVRDGETVVIGGVYRQRAETLESGVPWLNSIPGLGWLFKVTINNDSQEELLVFITPKIVWRDLSNAALPSARDLWQSRDRSAYRLLDSNPISEMPGG